MSPSRIVAALALASVAASVQLTAQAGRPATVRTEVQQAVRVYVDAWNKADASNLVEMYSREAGVTSVGDGEIIRGWDRIRERYDSLVGIEGRFKIAIGSTDVVPMGANNALALTSYTLTLHTDGGDVQERGAMTLVFQKVVGEWKVIHDHTSTLPTKTETQNTQAERAPVAPASHSIRRGCRRCRTCPCARSKALRDCGVRGGECQRGKLHYKFSINAAVCTISGRIIGLAGGNRDFDALIMDENNFLNWQTNHQAHAYWQSGQVAATNIAVRLAGPATYYLVINNAFSLLTPKTVKVQAVADC